MLEVSVNKIISITDARNSFNKIVEDVESDDCGLFVLTKGGTPSVALININYLEKLVGDSLSPQKEDKPMILEDQPQAEPTIPVVPGPLPADPTSPNPVPTPPTAGPTEPAAPVVPPASPSAEGTPDPLLPSTGSGELPSPEPEPTTQPNPTPSGSTWGQ